MNASTAMQARQAQAAIFSPRLQHAVRLLRLSSQDYAQALRDAAELNPFLEVDEPSAGVLAGGAVPAQDAHPGAGEEADAEAPIEATGAFDRVTAAPSAGAQHLPHDESAA